VAHLKARKPNILLGPDRLWIIDWAWPTRGASFIDAASFLIRAMAAGHLRRGSDSTPQVALMDSTAASRLARAATGRARLAAREPGMYFLNGKYMPEEPECAM
jgi:hypothetical protein